MSGALAPFEPSFDKDVIEQMQSRLRAAQWPVPVGTGWEWGVDLEWLRGLCNWWADGYEPNGLIERLQQIPGYHWEGLHVLHGRAPVPVPAEGGQAPLPVLLIHGWPGAPLEFRRLAPLLLTAGHDVVIPSLPGYGFSASPDPPLSATGVADRLRGLMAALGYARYVVQGGDWGAVIGARMAFDSPDAVAGFHCTTPGVLPIPPDLDDPPLSEVELDFAARAQRWRLREGYHLLVHAAAPEALGVGLGDSPAGLAAWLCGKYRAWSDCGGDLESRFSKDDLCDLLTFYWATGTVTSALRLYAAEAKDRWRLEPGQRIEAPVAVADFPGEIVRPPREWTARLLDDLRSWNEMPRGGHFAAFEEPDLLAADVLAFLAGL